MIEGAEPRFREERGPHAHPREQGGGKLPMRHQRGSRGAAHAEIEGKRGLAFVKGWLPQIGTAQGWPSTKRREGVRAAYMA